MNKLNDLHILLFSISSTSNRKITKNIMKVIANASNFNISSFFCSENSQSNMENILRDNNLFILIWIRTLFRGSQNPTTMFKKYSKMMTENFKAICVFERILQQNWSRDDLCIIKKKKRGNHVEWMQTVLYINDTELYGDHTVRPSVIIFSREL
jgi:hypothetical protein